MIRSCCDGAVGGLGGGTYGCECCRDIDGIRLVGDSSEGADGGVGIVLEGAWGRPGYSDVEVVNGSVQVLG